jgi:NitT/TauT family transport system substrate-binding protein
MAVKEIGILVMAVVLIAAGVLGCLEQQEDSGGEGAAIVMKVGAMPDEATLPYYVAEREGIFAAHGLNVTVVPFMSALERDSAFIAGEIDAGQNDPVGVRLV